MAHAEVTSFYSSRRSAMPLVKVSQFGLSDETKKKIATEMHAVIMNNTKAPSEAVWVMFEDVPRENWMIHEQMLSEKHPAEIFGK
jgi:phenylpyruvate tautomerase PptA (4-oxalocrotonate tautomerase family)